MLKLGFTLPKMYNSSNYSSTHANLYPLTERDKELFQKVKKDMRGG